MTKKKAPPKSQRWDTEQPGRPYKREILQELRRETPIDPMLLIAFDTLPAFTYLIGRGFSPHEAGNRLGVPHKLLEDIARDFFLDTDPRLFDAEDAFQRTPTSKPNEWERYKTIRRFEGKAPVHELLSEEE